MRQDKDRSGKWLIGHHAGAILKMAGVAGFTRWQVRQAEVVAPRRLPDGLIDVYFLNESKPAPFLIEIETYPDNTADDQVIEDILLVRLDRGVVPDVVSLILHSKGSLRVSGQVQQQSRTGRTRLVANWHVVELWQLNAADLFAMNDVGVVPWIPLTRFDNPPEVVLRQCRERIDQQADPREHDNLLVVTQILTALAFPNRGLLLIFGGEKVMIESPLLTEFEEKITRRTRQEDLINFLEGRFGGLSDDVVTAIRGIDDVKTLSVLNRAAGNCPDLGTFLAQLTAVTK